MRKIIEQAVVTLDGQISTPQDRLPTRWAGIDVKRLDNGVVGLTYVPTDRWPYGTRDTDLGPCPIPGVCWVTA